MQCGLWQAGARIEIDGIHIGTWFVGQVRIEGEEDAKFYSAIENIGVDCDVFFEKLRTRPAVLSAEKLRCRKSTANSSRKSVPDGMSKYAATGIYT